MKAMNGSGGLGARRVSRLLGCAVALAALGAMTVTSVASAKVFPVTRTYVALGDSLAFGYSQHVFNENLATGDNPAAFEEGYANFYLAETNKDSRKPYQLVNYGCPGETTESLIGNNPAFIAELNHKARTSISEPITGEAPCAYHTADGLPLHKEYGTHENAEHKIVPNSQLEAALKTIKTEKEAGTPVKVLSLNIGPNDELHEVARAEKEATAQVTAKVTKIVKPEAEAEVAAKVQAIAKEEVEAFVVEQVIPQATEEAEAGEPPTFAEDVAKDAGEYFAAHAAALAKLGELDAGRYLEKHGAELQAEGQKIGEELGAAYLAAHAAELHKEGEAIALALIKAALPAQFAQIDTNIVGILTAIKEDGFHGKLIFVAAYDPYGRVKLLSKEDKELEPGFNAAAAALAGLEQSTFAAAPHTKAVCYSNAETTFNVALSVIEKAHSSEYSPAELKLIGEEEENINTYTNMTNFSPFEYAPGKVLNYGEHAGPHGELAANGPDIHATKLGYEVMGKQMESTCSF
jgi:hypothetical protein